MKGWLVGGDEVSHFLDDSLPTGLAECQVLRGGSWGRGGGWGGTGTVSLRGSQSLSDWVPTRPMKGQRLQVKLTPLKLG